jgi:DNA-binding response OmpR family regulator
MVKRSFHGERILLVESNTRLLRSMAFLLQVVGFEVMAAGDGVGALGVLGKRLPDLMIADIDLPGRGGYHLLQQVRANRRWSSIPVVVSSNSDNFDDLLNALDLGADDYLPKPFDIHDVMDAVTRNLPMNTQPLRNIV